MTKNIGKKIEEKIYSAIEGLKRTIKNGVIWSLPTAYILLKNAEVCLPELYKIIGLSGTSFALYFITNAIKNGAFKK